MRINSLLRLPNLYFGAEQDAAVSLITQASLEPHPQVLLHGQFSLVVRREPFIYLIRDRLGINKLFYHIDRTEKTVTVGNSALEVAGAVGDSALVLSVSPGHYLKVHTATAESELISYYDISRVQSIPPECFDLIDFQEKANTKLSSFFEELNRKFSGSLFVVCLSGGLDSSVIASYAQRFLTSAVTTCFSYRSSGNNALSEDFYAASKIAARLSLPLIPVIAERDFELSTLDEVLRNCQDWRDFNVHCAWLNNQIGREIRARFPDRNLVFLTGDLMNEFVADYTPVTYKGSAYYSQPKLSRERLRRFLIYGLDTSDREVGIFHHWGITTIQPYSILAEEYLTIPEELIRRSNCKEILNLPLIRDPEIRNMIVKTKVRAQVGGCDGGTLGLFHDRNMSQSVLKTRWDEMFCPASPAMSRKPLIVSGRYRSQ